MIVKYVDLQVPRLLFQEALRLLQLQMSYQERLWDRVYRNAMLIVMRGIRFRGGNSGPVTCANWFLGISNIGKDIDSGSCPMGMDKDVFCAAKFCQQDHRPSCEQGSA
jgi:hypothetical protein